jgi:hypothetical protein
VKKLRIILTTVLLILALGTLASQFAQDASKSELRSLVLTGPKEPDMEKRATILGIVRTINTVEVTDFSQYGSYESWRTLRERHLGDLDGWLSRFYPSKANVHFGDMPEILPGWGLRLNVNADGQGYVLVLEDTTDKTGYAALSDERGVIRECKYLQ